MTIPREKVDSFFKKNKENISLEIVNKISSNTRRSFLSSEIVLTEAEEDQIKHILLTASNSKNIDEKTNAIFEELKKITSQIKSIQKQGILLIGESIFKARKLINQLTDSPTTFSDWICITFKTKSSAYNALSYYEFYNQLPTDDYKTVFQNIPFKAAYILSSRKVDFDKKRKILSKIQGLSNVEAISFINNTFPKRKKSIDALIQDKSLVNIILNKISYLSRLLSTFSDLENFQKDDLRKIIQTLSSMT